MANTLPDPVLGFVRTHCAACGYALEGIDGDPVCPECGTPNFLPDATLALCGVAKETEPIVWRRWAWGAIFTGWFVVSQVWTILALRKPYWMVLAFAVLTASSGAMLLTAKRRQRGSERFVFTPAGFSREGIAGDGTPDFVFWGERTGVDLRRVSSVWHRLRLTDHGVEKSKTLLDAGVRCPAELREAVAIGLERLKSGQRLELSDSPDSPDDAI